MPLFVKLPGSERGVVSESYASTVDVLPTIARALGSGCAELSTAHSAFGAVVRARTGVSMVRRDFGGRIRLGAEEMERRRAAERSRRALVFGTGSWKRLYAIGPRAGMLGRAVASLPVYAPGPAEARFASPQALDAVDIPLPRCPPGRRGGSRSPPRTGRIASWPWP